jgi:hypothetical protein
MEEVGKEELLLILQFFQKDKILRPDGLPMEIFLGCYDFIEEYFRRVVDATRTIEKNPRRFQHKFYSIDSQSDNTRTFENFRPISLCNYIYKIISKLIAKRLKRFLSKKISSEQFGFL